MTNVNLDGVAQFIAVAESGSFSAASVKLGISPSAVSQAVRGLEQRLGAALFNRTTRSVALTEAGTRYLESAAPALRDLQVAQEEVGDAAARPKGKLRLNVQRAAHMMVVQPILGRFLAAYPEIDVEVVIDVGLADVVRDGFDAGIRFGDVVEKDMVGINVGPPLTAHILASPVYLRERGTPRHPHDLLTHDCIGFRHIPTGFIERWAFAKEGQELEVTINGRLVFNDSAALVQAALDGLGITYMINGYIERFLDEGRLIRILADWSPPMSGFKLYYPSRRMPRKLRVLIDFIRAERAITYPDTAAILR
ncbi:LysR family transcriptional regulator [Agrobacterium vitis]|uniref:LysR family transcriptional regulator n=1 Tax=Agrobacterium vitis TaxID=373 RepID=UPI0012E849E4|nr:LysR family transcriptional regulator [Agrobacterium vitis]MUZ65643.1 LysR family transcriptional regulator [Agrobacterium vitis]